ncbi:hypothetical protein C8255_04040 [filamentous cyanobacterium CCP3]|nr:hypothetical protein C8255_04040 [filamentous cyanobacterium CCP3]
MQVLPVIDVVLLSWNRCELTIETVKSVLEQEDVITQIWIVDQGSRADELRLLKEFASDYSSIHITELKENVGVPGGRNVGTWLGNAQYTVSIDNDAVFESKDALKKVVEIFDAEPQIGIISFRIKNYYTKDDDELSWIFPKKLKQSRDARFLTTRFVGCGHAIRRNIFKDVNGYDADLFFYWEEVDLSYRAINLGCQILYCPDICVLHKVSPEARVTWENNRFYYLVRNAVYINQKYYQNFFRTSAVAVGYLVKGMLNKLPGQTLKGVLDGIKMCNKLSRHQDLSKLFLSNSAKDYIWQHELTYRGTFFNRLKSEVLVGLPGRD